MPLFITRRICPICCGLAYMLTSIGCTTLTSNLQSVNDALPWNAETAKTRKLESTPVRIAAVWTHDVVNVPGGKPVQGFGGRIYFYNYEQKAIQVHGELVVFTFDDTDASQQAMPNRTPDRKFVFRADQLQTHLSDSELGPSYSFWIPWQEFGGEQRLISLVPVFMPNEGRNVTGHFSKTSLPGKHAPRPNAQSQDQIVATRRATPGFQSKTISREHYPDNLNSTVHTTTFAVPQNLTRHLASSTTAPANHTMLTPATTPPNATPASTATQLPQQLNHRPQPYRSLTSPSGLKAIKVIPPDATRNAPQP
jgi:hypothetical protein